MKSIRGPQVSLMDMPSGNEVFVCGVCLSIHLSIHLCMCIVFFFLSIHGCFALMYGCVLHVWLVHVETRRRSLLERAATSRLY